MATPSVCPSAVSVRGVPVTSENPAGHVNVDDTASLTAQATSTSPETIPLGAVIVSGLAKVSFVEMDRNAISPPPMTRFDDPTPATSSGRRALGSYKFIGPEIGRGPTQHDSPAGVLIEVDRIADGSADRIRQRDRVRAVVDRADLHRRTGADPEPVGVDNAEAIGKEAGVVDDQ